MYEKEYKNDTIFLNALDTIKRVVYSKACNMPKSYEFRVKLEDRGICINSKIENIWNLANEELMLQNKKPVGRWEYYSPTDKIGKGLKQFLGIR